MGNIEGEVMSSKLSQLASVDMLADEDIFYVVQDGVSKQVSLETMRGQATSASGWQRPIDWLPMPATASNQLDILVAVYNNGSNFVALQCSVSSGTYHVDWGDGTSEDIASGVQANHLYSYSDSDLAGTESSRGYKQAIIVVTANTGNITNINLGKRHHSISVNYAQPFLDAQINAPSCSVFTTYGTLSCPILERCHIVAIGNITDATNMFNLCFELQAIDFPVGSLGGVTSAVSMFAGCRNLLPLTLPAGSFASVTNATSMFSACYSLQSITFPSGSLASVTNATSMFSNCYSLRELDFPTNSFAVLSVSTSMFNNCPSLSKIVGCAIPISFSLTNCLFDSVGLNSVYTSLPTVVVQTLTVTGNYGTAGDDPSIATAKGWIVV